MICRWHYRGGLSIREISCRTTLSRNTIAKYLHSEVGEAKYLRHSLPKNLDAFALQFLPGEAFPCGWSEETVGLAGEPMCLQVVHFKLSYSRISC